MRRLTTHSLLIGLLLAPMGSMANQSKEAKSPLVCWALPGLMARYFDNHVQYNKASDEIAKRVVELYSKRLDPAKVMLLEADFQRLKSKIKIAIAGYGGLS